MIKLVVLNGSPRKGGNTEILIERAIEAAKDFNVETRTIALNDLAIKPCQECGGCSATGSCVISDDMAIVYGALEEADIIIVASPIYFGSVTAQAKTAIDRMQCKWAGKYLLKKKPVKPARIGAFIACGAFKTDKYYNCAKQVVGIFYKVQDISFKESLFVPGVDDRGDVLKDKGHLENISHMVERLLTAQVK